MIDTLAVMGATGAVGRIIVSLLLEPDAFKGVQVAIGSTPDEVAAEFVPWAVEQGTVVVDESVFFRMDPNVPLVIPEDASSPTGIAL